jgi:ankyrin repeat protein
MSLAEEANKKGKTTAHVNTNLIQNADINTTQLELDSSAAAPTDSLREAALSLLKHSHRQQQEFNSKPIKQQLKLKSPLIKSTKPTIFSYIYANTNIVLNKFIMTHEEQLQRAITKGNADLCTELIALGCDVNRQVDNKFPICLACEYNQYEIAEMLIRHGADVNQFDFYDQSALIYAVDSASLEVIKLLIKNGASVSICDSNGMYPLHVAINRQDNEICDYLLSKKAPLNSSNM